LSADILLPSGGKVDCLIKVAIEESRFDIDLIAFKVEMVDKREEYPD